MSRVIRTVTVNYKEMGPEIADNQRVRFPKPEDVSEYLRKCHELAVTMGGELVNDPEPDAGEPGFAHDLIIGPDDADIEDGEIAIVVADIP